MRTRTPRHERSDGQRRRPRLQQLRRPDRRGRHARRRRRRARRRRHVLRHRRHLRQPGGSETLLGRVLQGRRDQVVLATKFGKPMGDGAERRGSPRLHPRARSTRRSQRLQTERIDLYQHHEEDPDTPLEETVGALEGAASTRARSAPTARRTTAPATLERGRARARARRAVRLGAERVLVAASATPRRELLPACERLGLGFIPYFPLASGLLTGKVTRDAAAGRGHAPARPDDRRRRPRPRRGADARGRRRTASRCSTSRSAASLAVSPVVSVIAGATKPEQVRANAAGRASGSRRPPSSPSSLAALT